MNNRKKTGGSNRTPWRIIRDRAMHIRRCVRRRQECSWGSIGATQSTFRPKLANSATNRRGFHLRGAQRSSEKRRRSRAKSGKPLTGDGLDSGTRDASALRRTKTRQGYLIPKRWSRRSSHGVHRLMKRAIRQNVIMEIRKMGESKCPAPLNLVAYEVSRRSRGVLENSVASITGFFVKQRGRYNILRVSIYAT